MVQENDVVLIYCNDQPLTFARIEEILPDTRIDWYHVKFLVLQIPVQLASWILKNDYIEGAEFTMNGKKMQIEKVTCPEENTKAEALDHKDEESKCAGDDKVIILADRKKSP